MVSWDDTLNLPIKILSSQIVGNDVIELVGLLVAKAKAQNAITA